MDGERKKQNEKFNSIRLNTQLKVRRETNEKLRKLDNKLNLNLHLQNNPKYLSIGRQQSRTAGQNGSLLGPVLMSRIVTEASKYYRMREKLENNCANRIYLLNNYVFNNPELDFTNTSRRRHLDDDHGISLGFRKSIENIGAQNRVTCDRFKRNLSRFESKELMQSMATLNHHHHHESTPINSSRDSNNQQKNSSKISFALPQMVEDTKSSSSRKKLDLIKHSHSLPMTAHSSTRPHNVSSRSDKERQQQHYSSFAVSVNNKLKLFEQFQQQQSQKLNEMKTLSSTTAASNNKEKKTKIFI